MAIPAVQVAADKRAIDEALLELCRAAKVKVSLPAANPDPARGPFAHLRAALKVLPSERLAKRFPRWAGGWFDRLARNHFPPGAEAAKRRWKPMSAAEKTVIASGTGVISKDDGAVLWLSPAGPGAAVFCLGTSSLEQLAVSVRDFAEREVGHLLDRESTTVTLEVPAGAKAFANVRRGLERLRRTQPSASVRQADLVSGSMVEGFRDAEALLAMAAAASSAGTSCFFGFGDAENADDKTLWGHPWLVGRSVAHTRRRVALKPVDAKSPVFLVARGGGARATLFAGPRQVTSTIDFVKLTPKQLASATHLVAEADD